MLVLVDGELSIEVALASVTACNDAAQDSLVLEIFSHLVKSGLLIGAELVWLSVVWSLFTAGLVLQLCVIE